MIKPYITKDIIITKNRKRKIKYSGMLYEIWTQIKYINNWENNVKEIEYKPDYDKCIDAIVNKKVDIMVGNLWIFEQRMRLVDFTRPIFLSKIVIVYKPKSMLKTYFNISFQHYIKPLLIIILIGLLFGFFLSKIEPKRGFKRSLLTSIATLFGEAGYLFERASLSLKGSIYVIIFMAIAYIITMVFQGIITTKILGVTNDNEINKNNIKNQKLLISNRLDIGEILSKYGIKYDSINIKIKDTPTYYLKNLSKYNGYLTEYEHTKIDKNKYPELVTTKDIFGYEENAFALRKGLHKLTNDINIAITVLQKTDKIQKICAKYISKNDSAMCIL